MALDSSHIKLTFPNGRVSNFSIEEFNYYAATNELQHKTENIIISLNKPTSSFLYELDDAGEIAMKELLDGCEFC